MGNKFNNIEEDLISSNTIEHKYFEESGSSIKNQMAEALYEKMKFSQVIRNDERNKTAKFGKGETIINRNNSMFDDISIVSSEMVDSKSSVNS